MSVVLDASAVLAYLFDESGAERVEPSLDGAIVPAPNWAEVMQKVAVHGGDAVRIGRELSAVGIEVQPVGREIAEMAALLWADNRRLSLGDRFCLATAITLDLEVLTADHAWADISTRAKVVVIR